MKKHAGFILFFAAVIIVFFWKMMIMRAAFLYGDYADQVYPWSLIYAESVKNFQFPFWTRFFQSGFPLMAEGQVGGFYPLNLLFFFFLPFHIAYNYIVIAHFVLAGVFTYMLTRKLGACQWGGALAALLFCFGSAYAGCMINTSTVKTLIWFPFVLWLFEGYFQSRKLFLIITAGAVLGIQLLAGSTQIALYMAVFYFLYFTYGLFVRNNLRIKDILNILMALGIAAIIFLPQFILSSELAEFSWRSGASLGFALSGSFSPLNFMSVTIPHVIFRGARFYIGVFSLLFLVTAFLSIKRDIKLRPVFLVLLASVFLALGKYNPLYVLFIKVFRLYGLRGPNKFLLAGIFAASVLAGRGFTRFFENGWDEVKTRSVRAFSIFITIMLALFFFTKMMIAVLGEKMIDMGEWFVTNHIYGKDFHRYDLSVYFGKVKSMHAVLLQNMSITNPFILISLGLCVAALIICVRLSRQKRLRPWYKGLFITIIFLDLYAASFYGTGFRGNITGFDVLAPECPALFDIVQRDKDLFRILPYGIASARIPGWAEPSLNSVYGIDNVALYTPLVNDYYREELAPLEVVDNALGLKMPEPGALDKKLDLIRMLNVKYVISTEILEKDFLDLMAEEDGRYLYRLKGSLPRAFIAKQRLSEEIDRNAKVNILEYGSGKALFRADMPYDGYLAFSENRYPGWKVYVDGEEREILPFSVIQAVKLEKGAHSVKFVYKAFGR
ncbi:MAG: hypothetical protein ABIA77_01640 [Candidatus Omnitrophota bacterium]